MDKELKKLVIDDTAYETRVTPKYLRRKPYTPGNGSRITAVIPGVIQEVFVKPGQHIQRNDKLLTLEAMKMKNAIISPFSGVVKQVNVKPGITVAKGELLLELE